MQQKQENNTLEEDTLRCRLLSLFKTNLDHALLPLNHIEIILEFVPYLLVLRYPIDFFTIDWLGYYCPIFSYFDLSFYLGFVGDTFQQVALVLALLFATLYWAVPLSLYLAKHSISNTGMNFRRIVFLVTRNLLYLPILNVVLGLFSHQSDPFHTVIPNASPLIAIVAVLLLVPFTFFLLVQSFLNFQLIAVPNKFARLRVSAYTPPALLALMVLNETIFVVMENMSSLVVYGISIVLLLALFLLKNEHLNERMKLIELSFLCVGLLGLLMVVIMVLLSQTLDIQLFFLLSVFTAGAVMNLKTYSLTFQIENINKWPTAEIMIRYTNTLRYYLSRRDEYLFRVYIHGYMEIHRHKCDNELCPSRRAFTHAEQQLFESGKLKNEDKELLRCENIVKKIYEDGYRLTPTCPELQLQNCIFLYECGEKDLSLKNLLAINFESLSLDRYYRYHLLKLKIHREMSEKPDFKFIDLVNELTIKHLEDDMVRQLDKAGLTNLEFWSILNEDHPDFQKLNQTGSARIQIREQVKETYRRISEIAYNEKITSLYVQYLEAIENDEAVYNVILQQVKERYQLESRITLQDWANTSQAIMLVSVEDNTYATITDVNSSCAQLFGFEKYELLNHHLDMLLSGPLKQNIPELLSPKNIEQLFAFQHKSGYIIPVRATSRSYNSMETGMTAIITIVPQLSNKSCKFFIARQTKKIIGITSSTIPLLGLQLKSFEDEVLCNDFFKINLDGLAGGSEKKLRPFNAREIINEVFDIERVHGENEQFNVRNCVLANCDAVEMEQVAVRDRTKMAARELSNKCPFEFQVLANAHSFKFFGSSNPNDSYVTMFSQVSYQESLKSANHPAIAYQAGITTLRLRDNIIQVIEEVEDEECGVLKKKGAVEVVAMERLPRKEEEEVFSSKTVFEQFIEGYTYARSVNLILLVTFLGLLALYIFFCLTFIGHANNLNSMAGQIGYSNLISGAVAKEYSLLLSLQQMRQGQSQDSVSRLVQDYNDNLNYLSSIKFMGGQPFKLSLQLGGKTIVFESNQYIFSFINYANIVSDAITPLKNASQLQQALGAAQQGALQYLLANCPSSAVAMSANTGLQEAALLSQVGSYQRFQVLMLVGGVLFVGLITLLMLFALHKINKERISIFEVFLDITEIQIQQFSSKTEKFLMALHVEDANGEIDVDEEVENTKKINSSTFAKKKRFKHINFNKNIYFKLLVIPVVGLGFFLHSFITSYLNLNFQGSAYHYFSLTSQADLNFYTGLAGFQTAVLNNQSLPNDYSKQYMVYYRDYFNLHFSTFGYVDDFHQAFTDIFMTDICNGMDTPYGSTKIPVSCQLPELYPNGSYLVFTDLTVKTEFLSNASSLSYDYLVGHDVLSKTHRTMTEFLIEAESQYTAGVVGSLVSALIVWIVAISLVILLYGVPIMKRFVDEINEIKNILSILPISVARVLPLATPYFNKIIRAKHCCSWG